MNIFENNDYKYISEMIEGKINILRENEKFDKSYIRLADAIEELEKSLNTEQRSKFDEIVQLFYTTEEFYFAFSYSLGVKYGKDLEKI